MTVNSKDEVQARREARAFRIADEQSRIADVRAFGKAPDACGPEVVKVAPGRGPITGFTDMEYREQEDGTFKPVNGAFDGRKIVRRGDAFDVMADQARRKKADAPFAPAEVSIGRYYRDLVERHASAGMQGSSVENVGGGSGSGGGFMDRVLKDGDEIKRLRFRIGSGCAMAVRRVRPSARGSRVSILDRRVVDMVCLEDQTLADVLRAHGWVVNGENVKVVRTALIDVFGRMMGGQIARKTYACSFGYTSSMGKWED